MPNRTDYDDLMSIHSVTLLLQSSRCSYYDCSPTDIPASLCDNADDIPDPIMKHYVNDLVFADQKLLIEIEKVLMDKIKNISKT